MAAVLASAEEVKKQKNCLLLNCAMHFLPYPFVIFVDGVLGHETLMFLQFLADKLSGSWDVLL